MRIYTISQARQNISEVLNIAAAGEPIGIARRDGTSAVLISREDFSAWREARLDAEFAEIMKRHGRTIEMLTDK
ncbi:putative cytoplasmic protein [Trabulsiella guamensis ATCC 49490]|uniref:Antitoxin n=1 Tax=Trabulsiella guamensis ATCC 49490 TaxID=1005994 RepID=A0A084ZQD1_9ENTR|nr:type II toxin-antitoxin system prevent-host-death family antitoxin [Trabulsiella guamensis]KFB99675.1 putative cytoplasmic protein [Trabulsiella guamensis ATCC 49490]